ncbi:MAG TPA: GGDEF domain-containing protein [Candidatus Acidoferrales bacterium]|nr:GGDEF domain-containing protein [Candidatus Acidoferrales bacterium]
MRKPVRLLNTIARLKWGVVWFFVGAAFLAFLWTLRRAHFYPDPLLERYLQFASSVLAFTFAANALVRFRGMHDRITLILAFAFGLAGLIEMGANLGPSSSVASLTVPLAWMVSRTLLAILLVAALLVDRSLPLSREPNKEIAWALLIVGAVSYLTSVVFFAVPVAPRIYPHAIVPRPWDLLPAAIYFIATIGFWKRLDHLDSLLDRSLFLCCAANVACHVAMSQSSMRFDAASGAAQLLEATGYAIVLAGALLDNAKLFDQVSRLAISDPLTGLANYRRLLEVMEAELQRAQRTSRGFSVLLLDLDGLKKINDNHGHLIGSQALKRLANVLRYHCRGMDTAARYGGDEFALVLPEAEEDIAVQVAHRIRKRLLEDGIEPRISVSAGVAVYPRDGLTIEKLLHSADNALYAMKSNRDPEHGESLFDDSRGKQGAGEWQAEEKGRRRTTR